LQCKNGAKRELRAILAEAKQTGLIDHQCKARLELGKLEISSARPPPAERVSALSAEMPAAKLFC